MTPTIRLGSLGEPVMTLQSALNLWLPPNWARLDIDGFFGLRTNRTVRDYQSANELAPDGVVGPLTWELLRPLVEQVLGSSLSPANDREADDPIVPGRAREGATGASPASSTRAAAARAWTASPSARWEATARRARSA